MDKGQSVSAQTRTAVTLVARLVLVLPCLTPFSHWAAFLFHPRWVLGQFDLSQISLPLRHSAF